MNSITNNKKLFLTLSIAGIITNALYLFGDNYYQGYIKRLGFDYNLFSIDWATSIFWTYNASIYLVTDIIKILTAHTLKYSIIGAIIVYLFYLAYSSLQSEESDAEKGNKDIILPHQNPKKSQKNNTYFKRTTKKIISTIFSAKHRNAMEVSYYSFAFTTILPLLLLVWIAFPFMGSAYGKHVAEKQLKSYNQLLCGTSNEYWNQCISLKINTNDSTVRNINGRLILKKGNLLAILTKSGPVTLTMPQKYYQEHTKNPNFQKKAKPTTAQN